jgi:hypothetical protein
MKGSLFDKGPQIGVAGSTAGAYWEGLQYVNLGPGVQAMGPSRSWFQGLGGRRVGQETPPLMTRKDRDAVLALIERQRVKNAQLVAYLEGLSPDEEAFPGKESQYDEALDRGVAASDTMRAIETRLTGPQSGWTPLTPAEESGLAEWAAAIDDGHAIYEEVTYAGAKRAAGAVVGLLILTCPLYYPVS